MMLGLAKEGIFGTRARRWAFSVFNNVVRPAGFAGPGAKRARFSPLTAKGSTFPGSIR